MRKVLANTAAWFVGGSASLAAAADLPPVEQLLKYKPAQQGVLCDTPAAETWPKCKVEYVNSPAGKGYVVRDMNGLTVRKLLAAPGSKAINIRAYYAQGQEVYRETDTNGNGISDEFKWYNAGGSRIGVTADDESQKIVKWKALSAEEATAELVAAIASQDWTRLERVMLTEADVKELGLSEKSAARVSAEIEKSKEAIKSLAEQLTADTKWTRFDGHTPMAIAAADVGAAKDLMLYHNGTIAVEVAGKPTWLRAPEVVRIGDVWKLTTMPTPIDDKKAIESAGVLVPALDQKAAVAAADGDSPVEASEEVQKLVGQLQTHDEAMPKDGDPQALVAYHKQRHILCASIGAKSMKLANREHWYKQAADSLDAAVQSKAFPEGIGMLEKYSDKFGTYEWGKNLAAYYKYRAINAAYSLKADGKDDGKAQETYLADLAKFIKDFPTSPDAADALWQLGNGAEFAGKEHDALGHYKELSEKHAKSNFAKKAAGAIRRIEAVGRPARFAGDGLEGSPIDTAQYRGKVVLVHYWATWCEACVAEVPRLAAAREKFGAKGFEIVGVNIDTDVAKAAAKAQQLKMAWPQLQDKGGLEGELATQFGIVILPTMMLLDESGKVLHRNLQATALDVEIEKALSKKIASKND
jgi:thiol-disulfide isomerase/thioredoxin